MFPQFLVLCTGRVYKETLFRIVDYLFKRIDMKFEKQCKQCNTAIAKHKTFCNSSCSAKYNNTRREKKPYPCCKNCNNQLTNRLKIYCNHTCQREFEHREIIIPRFECGNIQSRSTLRNILNKYRGHVCNSCGITEHNGKYIVLEVSHIDGNAYNNFPTNLELLCPNCHSQTDTYKGRNMGSGRKSRVGFVK